MIYMTFHLSISLARLNRTYKYLNLSFVMRTFYSNCVCHGPSSPKLYVIQIIVRITIREYDRNIVLFIETSHNTKLNIKIFKRVFL